MWMALSLVPWEVWHSLIAVLFAQLREAYAPEVFLRSITWETRCTN